MNYLVFDIETIPDVAYGRRLLQLPDLTDRDVAAAMFAQRRQQSGNDFLPLEQQRIVAIACAMRRGESFRLWSLGSEQSSEKELLERFFEGLEKFTPDLVSWNGSGFDLPVMHYRCLLHGVQAARYWEHGDEDSAFRYNSYLGRYHWRHLDLMDVLSGFQPRGRASLANVAALLGLPGKMGFAGDQVWGAWLDGNITGIRRYCETDVLNTYLILLAFERNRGLLQPVEWAAETAKVREFLQASAEPHHQEFLSQWVAAAPI
jgi:3'-5' exonuclease